MISINLPTGLVTSEKFLMLMYFEKFTHPNTEYNFKPIKKNGNVLLEIEDPNDYSIKKTEFEKSIQSKDLQYIMQDNLTSSFNSTENNVNERKSFNQNEISKNYDLTRNLNFKKISDPGKNNPTNFSLNQPLIRYKKNIVNQLLKQLDFLKKKNEYTINMGEGKIKKFHNYVLFIDNFLDALLNKMLIYIYSQDTLQDINKQMFENLLNILKDNISLFENFILENKTGFLIDSELSFADLSLAISLYKSF